MGQYHRGVSYKARVVLLRYIEQKARAVNGPESGSLLSWPSSVLSFQLKSTTNRVSLFIKSFSDVYDVIKKRL